MKLSIMNVHELAMNRAHNNSSKFMKLSPMSSNEQTMS